MREAIAEILHSLSGIDLGEIIRTLSVVVTAAIAILALRNWRRQDRAKREAEFLDGLVDATHELIAQLPGPLTMLDMIHIGFKSRANNPDDDDERLRGAALYIRQHGKEQHKLLSEEPNRVRPLRARLKSLAAKGQMFDFINYQPCITAVESIANQVDRLEQFGAVVASADWNWEHPEAQRILMGVLATTTSDIRPKLNAGNVQILDFSRDTYSALYGKAR